MGSWISKEPDRVFGLQCTRNFEDLLSCPVASAHTHAPETTTLADTVRSSPFSAKPDPLLFPFLLLEAKAEKGKGFEDIQVQSAFPIWAFLRLQETLLEHQPDNGPSHNPFVWFLASRGDTWRVYACCLTKKNGDLPAQYVSGATYH